MQAEDSIIAQVDKARLLLAAARDVSQVKQVVDLAHATEVYTRRQKLSEEAIEYANAVKVDAMTLMGEMLKTAEKNKGGGEPGVGRRGKECGNQLEPHSVAPPPTLADLGISKKESAAAQALATLKEKAPEVHAEVRAGKTTTKKAAAKVREQEEPKPQTPKPPSKPAERPTTVAKRKFNELFNDLSPQWTTDVDKQVMRQFFRELLGGI